VELIKYQYALEVEPGYSVKNVLHGLEADLNTYLASKLLPCAVPDRMRRQLQEDIGLVALDSRPEDKNDTTGTRLLYWYTEQLCYVITSTHASICSFLRTDV
jgi:hypothetical protein